VEVRHTKHHRVSSGKALYMPWGRYPDRRPGGGFGTPVPEITHYRIITPAPTPPLFLGGDPVKPPEPEMTKTHEDYTGPTFGVPTKPEPDLITLRLECLKLALQESSGTDYQRTADIFLHYVLNGSVDKA